MSIHFVLFFSFETNFRLTNNICALLDRLDVVVDEVNLKGPPVADACRLVDLLHAVLGQPRVELAHPVLDGVDGHDAEHAATRRAAQEALDERDHLSG